MSADVGICPGVSNSSRAELLHKFGSEVLEALNTPGADAMEVTMLLILHLSLVSELGDSPALAATGRATLVNLALAGGPVFLQYAHRQAFLNRTGILKSLKWTKQQYSAMRRSFDLNKNKWSLLVNSLSLKKLV